MTKYDYKRGDAALISALAGGASLRQAAALAGVSASTAYRRTTDPQFQEQVDQARAELIDQAIGKIASASAEASDTLHALLNSPRDYVRFQAAAKILDAAIAVSQNAELERRLAALEAEVADAL